MTGSATPLGTSAQRLLVILLALFVVASACTSDGASTAGGRTEVSPAEVSVTSLEKVSQLRNGFNADAGKVRLVLLLSPT